MSWAIAKMGRASSILDIIDSEFDVHTSHLEGPEQSIADAARAFVKAALGSCKSNAFVHVTANGQSSDEDLYVSVNLNPMAITE